MLSTIVILCIIVMKFLDNNYGYITSLSYTSVLIMSVRVRDVLTKLRHKQRCFVLIK